MRTTQTILKINRGTRGHWVGDGFPVHTLLSYDEMAQEISPFLLLDYAGPMEFEPTSTPRGVGEHPHRGFETVTVVYQGEVEHHDNAGNAGSIGPGDIQWMTAGRGILHQEYHSQGFTRVGGTLEMVQLWVNLPAEHKMTAPRYQEIRDRQVPAVPLPNDAGQVRVIAGSYAQSVGPAQTFTPINLWDMRIKAGAEVDLPLPQGHQTSLLVLTGQLMVNDEAALSTKELAVLAPQSEAPLRLRADADSTVLLMSGDPIREPVVGRGPFVMNTQAEIRQAMADYHEGRF